MTPGNALQRLKEAFYGMRDPGNATTIRPDRQFAVVRLISAGAETRTLARPTRSGIFVTLNMVTDGGDITLTVTGAYDETGTTTMVFSDTGDFAIFESMEEGSGTYVWRLIRAEGVSGPVEKGGSLSLAGTLAVTGATTLTGALTPTGGVAAAGGFTATPCGLLNTSGYQAIVSTYGTDATPVTTTVYVVEILVPCNMTLTGVRYLNGSAVGNGTVTIGLYTSAGVAIAAALTAATTTAGIDTYQSVPFATPYAAVGPAKYLIGFQFSSGTDRYNTHISGFTSGFGIAQASATIGVTAISPVPTAVVAGAAVVAGLY